jgi:hypothetical protein
MAYFCHRVRWITESFDILVTRAGVAQIRHRLGSWGYVNVVEGSRVVWDAECGVRITFLVVGDYPGDQTPKPVSFPNPDSVAVELAGISVLPLPILVELSLAAAMSESGRLWDLAAVVGSIRRLDLPRDFATRLIPYVRPKFEELWDGPHRAGELE